MMARCRVTYDVELHQHSLEFDQVDASCTLVERGNLTAWIRNGETALLVIDRNLDGGLEPDTDHWLQTALEPRLFDAIVQRSVDATIEVAESQAATIAEALTPPTPPLPTSSPLDTPLDVTQRAPITLRSSDSDELAGEAWIPVGVDRSTLPLNGDRPASVLWRPPTGEFRVRLPTREGGTWPRELWLRVSEEPEGWVIAAAPVGPDGEANTILARESASFDGLRLDVGRSVSNATAVDSRQSRNRLASLAAVATEAEQAGDFATAAAAWTAAAAFADEILDDSAAERFRHRAEATTAAESRKRRIRWRKWPFAGFGVILLAIALSALWLGGTAGTHLNTSAGSFASAPSSLPASTAAQPTSTSNSAAVATTATSTPFAGHLRTSGTFRQSLGHGHGPLSSTLAIDLKEPTVPLGGSIKVAFEFTYDDIGRYPANLYRECLNVIDKSRSTGGWKSEVPTYVLILPAGATSASSLSTYNKDLSLSDFRNIGVGQVLLADSRVHNCGDPPPPNVDFQVDQHLIFQIYSATIDVSDLTKGPYVVIPMMTGTPTNTHGFPESVDGDLVGFSIT